MVAMKLALIVGSASFVSVCAMALSLGVFIWLRKLTAEIDEELEDLLEFDENEALEIVTEAISQSPEFAAAWGRAALMAADQVTARIAGQHMAGNCDGMVQWVADVPQPEEIPREIVKAAFSLVVRTEVARRINAMTGPGSFG